MFGEGRIRITGAVGCSVRLDDWEDLFDEKEAKDKDREGLEEGTLLATTCCKEELMS